MMNELMNENLDNALKVGSELIDDSSRLKGTEQELYIMPTEDGLSLNLITMVQDGSIDGSYAILMNSEVISGVKTAQELTKPKETIGEVSHTLYGIAQKVIELNIEELCDVKITFENKIARSKENSEERLVAVLNLNFTENTDVDKLAKLLKKAYEL